jgi:hypothetical protein
MSVRATEKRWRGSSTARQNEEELAPFRKPIAQRLPEQYMVLVICQDEKHQLELIARFQNEELDCKALQS